MARFISFKKKYAEKILAGEKTATIRLSDFFRENEIYDVRVGWFNPPVCRIKIIKKTRKLFYQITQREIEALGFKTLSELKEAVRECYGIIPPPNLSVWIYNFEIMPNSLKLGGEKKKC